MADKKQSLLEVTRKHIQALSVDATAYYNDLKPLDPPGSYAETLVDVFWMLWVRYEGLKSPERMNLVALIKACHQDKRVSDRQLQEVLEPDCLQAVGLLREGLEAFRKKEIRVNTRINYTISKFNLLREDSEGYAKLITLLNAFGPNEALRPAGLPVLTRELRSLIGCFDLDPNRCLDLLLDAAGVQLSAGGAVGRGAATALLGAVDLLKADAVGQLMGFKLQHYQAAGQGPAPRSLFLAAALLVQMGKVPLLDVLGHLAPNDEAQAKAQRAAREALKARVDDIGAVKLSGAPVEDTRQQQGRERGGRGELQETADAGGMRRAGLSAAAFDLDPAAAIGSVLVGPEVEANQPLSLLDALLEVGAWDAARELFERLSALGVAPAAHTAISGALCRLLAQEVDKRYEALFPQGTLGRNCLTGDAPPAPGAPAPQLTPLAVQLLQMLGCFLHRDVRLFTRVVRLLHYTLLCAGGAVDAAPADGPSKAAGRSVVQQVEELLVSVLLPALICVPMHLPLASELWDMMRLLPVQTRFRIYADLKELSSQQPYLQAASRLAVLETKKVLKRLVLPSDQQKKKEACRPHARMIAKVAHANPLPVMETIVAQVEAYDNQIEPAVDVMRYLSPMTYDVLTFVILSRLSLERDKVKEDGVNISSWLQSLARFTGQACRRYQDIEVGAILQFLVNALRSGDSFDLLVLQQIVTNMTGVRLEARLSDDQLESYAGGPELIAETVVVDNSGGAAADGDGPTGPGGAAAAVGGSSTSSRADKVLARGRSKLLKALLDADGRRGGNSGALALPLLILTAQQRSVILKHTESKLIKFIATMYDRCQDILLHLAEFLRLAMPLDQYANMLPPPDVLRNEYGIDSEVVWHVYRPVMARLLDMAAPQPLPRLHPVRRPRVGDKAWAGILSSLPKCVSMSALWDIATPELFATFWSLQLSDIYVPQKRYEREISDTRARLQQLENNYTQTIRPAMNGHYGVSVHIQNQYEAYKQERQVQQDKVSRLTNELEERRKHVAEVRTRLELQARNGGFFRPFPAPPASYAAGITAQKPYRDYWSPVVQELVLPRVLMGSSDALYAARFFFLMCSIGASNFYMMHFIYDSMRFVSQSLAVATEVEATSIGVWQFETIKTITNWRLNEKSWREECETRPAAGWPSEPYSKTNNTWNGFCKNVALAHTTIASIFKLCTDSKDYMNICNALTVANRMVSVFPAVDLTARNMQNCVQKLIKAETREDIKTMARSYEIALTREMAKGPSRMWESTVFGGPIYANNAAQAARRAPAGSPAAAAAAGRGGARPAGAAAGRGAASLSASARPYVPPARQQQQAAEGGAKGTAPASGSKAPAGNGGAAGASGQQQQQEEGEIGSAGRKRPRSEAPAAAGSKPSASAAAANGAGGQAPTTAAKAQGPGNDTATPASTSTKKARTEEPPAKDKERERGERDNRERERDREGGGRGSGGTDGGGREGRDGGGEDGGRSAVGQTTSETSRGQEKEGSKAKEGRPSDVKEHKRSRSDKDKEGKDKDKEGKDKDKDKERDKDRDGKQDKKDKDKDKEERREEKERRREDKEREKATVAGEGNKDGGRSGGDKGERDGGAAGKGDGRSASADRRGGANGILETRRGGSLADHAADHNPPRERDKSTGRGDRASDKDRSERTGHADRRTADDDPEAAGSKRRRMDTSTPPPGPTPRASQPDLRELIGRRATGAVASDRRDAPAAAGAAAVPDNDLEYDSAGFALPRDPPRNSSLPPSVPAARRGGGSSGAAAGGASGGPLHPMEPPSRQGSGRRPAGR